MPCTLTVRASKCLIIFLLCTGICQGQKLPREILFERVTIPGTIRSSHISNITQDELGMIWLTGTGLYQYDGLQFHLYNEVGPGKTLCSPNDLLFLLSDTISNRILIGTQRFGIVSYTYQDDRLMPLPVSDDPPAINHLAQTPDGQVWAASFSGGLYYLDHDTLTKVSDPKKIILHPTSPIANGSKLYVGDIGKIVMLEGNRIAGQITLPSLGGEPSSYIQVTAIHIDKSQKLWIGTEKHGVLVYDLNTSEYVKHFSPAQSSFFNRVTQIHQDRDGLMWILTKASGLIVYSPSEDRMMHFTRDPFSNQSLSSDNCFSIAEDRQGIIWISATGGLNKYDRKQIKFRHINNDPFRKLSLTDNMVRGVYEDSREKLWIGTDGGYINIIDLKNESVESMRVTLKDDSAIHVPLYFLELDARTMLIGSSLGLLQYDLLTKTFSAYKPLWAITEKKAIRQLLRNKNTLYFIHNRVLFMHDLVTNQTEQLRNSGDSEAVNVTAIHLDKEDRLWAGTDKGISLFDPFKKTFTLIPLKNSSTEDDGSLLLILSIEHIGNKLYAATYNSGLWEIDMRYSKPEPKNYTEQHGLPSNTVYATLEDEEGNIWLSTNNGLAKFEVKSNRFISFTLGEGVQEGEFNRLAHTKTRDGHLVFGGINGINVFYPPDVPAQKDMHIPRILSVSATNPMAKDPSVVRYTDIQEKLTLPHDQNFLTIHFFVPNYRQPKRYNVLYKLENFEKEWRTVSGDNLASYTNLRPGSYTFLLKTVGSDGEEVTTKLAFAVALPYWRTWWFIVISFFVLAFLILTIMRGYIRRAENERHRLEQLLKIRTSEIERSREELQVLNQKKDLIFSILSHDLRSPLTTLKGFLGYVIDHADKLTWEDLKKHVISIRNSVTNSLDLIDNTLFWSLSQMGNIQYVPSDFSLHDLIEKLRGLYQLTADKKRIPMSISCDEGIMLHGDENMVYVILRNLVSNALKFTMEGNPVFITCTAKDGFAEVNVIDHGIGMSPDYLRRILSMDQPMLKKGTSNEKGTGLGLLLCKKFVEINKGELHISSIEDVGTTFTVTLPIAVAEPVGSRQEQ